MANITVYHATNKGNGQSIVQNGWETSHFPKTGHLYGCGIYFWELMSDAEAYGHRYFNGQYDIVTQVIPYRNVLSYDSYKRQPNNNDSVSFSKAMLARGYELVVVQNPLIETSVGMNYLKGKAYVWLVNPDIPYVEVLI